MLGRFTKPFVEYDNDRDLVKQNIEENKALKLIMIKLSGVHTPQGAYSVQESTSGLAQKRVSASLWTMKLVVLQSALRTRANVKPNLSSPCRNISCRAVHRHDLAAG